MGTMPTPQALSGSLKAKLGTAGFTLTCQLLPLASLELMFLVLPLAPFQSLVGFPAAPIQPLAVRFGFNPTIALHIKQLFSGRIPTTTQLLVVRHRILASMPSLGQRLQEHQSFSFILH
jgi:hypothetical protein